LGTDFPQKSPAIMNSKLLQMWINLRSSFWFIPTLMIFAAALLAAALVEADAYLGSQLTERFPLVFGTNALGARSILSTIASSMIGVAGVTFSITIVVLSQTSAQYTSRILRNFMRDRANQVVLGVFVSVFVYCLLVLRSVRGGEESCVPSLSVATGILLGIVGIGFLIFFIHHVATSIQASTIISRIGNETLNVIDGLYPEHHRGEGEDSAEAASHVRDNSWAEVPSTQMGFVQSVDTEGLMHWAEKNQTLVHMRRGVGEFVIAGEPLLAVARKDVLVGKFAANLNAFFGVASFRTIEQDAAFGIRQLVDISLKALSPGVNDTTTAVTCLHHLGAILGRLNGRKIPGEIRRRAGSIRLIARIQTHRYFVDEALSQIRRDARGNVAIHLTMLEAVEAAIQREMSDERRAVFMDHVRRMEQVVDKHVEDREDLGIVRARIQDVAAMMCR
jgi:uncharacterized membrane protein